MYIDHTATGRPLAQAGYVITGSGGGGEGGHYVFANLADLDTIITDLETLLADIQQDRDDLERTAGLITPPAEDHMSTGQADAVVTFLEKARTHNLAMDTYAANELAKLKAARQTYATTDDNAATRLRSIDEAGQ
jgi:hypothetical protein